MVTHTSGHPSAAGRAQNSESTSAEDPHYTTQPRNQLTISFLGGLVTQQLLAHLDNWAFYQDCDQHTGLAIQQRHPCWRSCLILCLPSTQGPLCTDVALPFSCFQHGWPSDPPAASGNLMLTRWRCVPLVWVLLRRSSGEVLQHHPHFLWCTRGISPWCLIPGVLQILTPKFDSIIPIFS